MQDQMARFRKQFAEETLERIRSVNNLALELEQQSPRRELVEQLKREMHTIKGGSRILGLRSISNLAHHFEDLFAQVMGGQAVPPHLANRLLAALDLMQSLLDLEESEETAERVRVFLETPAAPAAAPPEAKEPLDLPRPQPTDPKKLLEDRIRNRIRSRSASAAPPSQEPPPLPEVPKADTEPPPVQNAEAARPEDTSIQAEAVSTQPSPTPVPQAQATPRTPAEPKSVGLTRSFRIDGALIDTLSEGALQLKVMGTVFDVALDEFAAFAHSTEQLQLELARLLRAGASRETLEDLQYRLRDLAKNASSRKKFLSSRVAAYRGYFDSFYRNLEEVKLIPLATFFSVYPRFMRDHALASGKRIVFDHQGGGTRLDKRIAEVIGESLIHLLRNSVDHAIESPEERLSAGKNPEGQIQLLAAAKGDFVRITVRDDGRGFDPDRIRETALRKGLIQESDAARMSEDELLSLVFLPGFSTAPIITDTSGRGVGMDVVQSAVKGFGGNVRIKSQKGKGTEIVLDLPITISTTRVLQVRDGGQICAIPTEHVREVRRVHLPDLTRRGNRHFLLSGGRTMPAACMSDILGFGDGETRNEWKVMLVLASNREAESFGLLVDQTLKAEDVIIFRKDPFIQGIPHVAGIFVTVYGEPFLTLDVESLERFFHGGRTEASVSPRASGSRPQLPVLLVEDSLVTREMEKAILESAGFTVVEATNGIEGLERLGSHKVGCVITDVEMPGMDGFTMTQEIRKNPEWKDLPVVVVTTRETREDKIRGIQVGANAYITKKDFDQMKLVETIHRLVD